MRLFSAIGILAVVAAGQCALATPIAEIRPHLTVAGEDFDDLRYLTPQGTGYDGVGGLLIDTSAGTFLCSGALMSDGIHMLTAAHCLTDFFGNPDFLGGTATFFPNPDGVEVLEIVSAVTHPDFNSFLEAGNDIAILTLAAPASAGVQRYNIYRGADEVGKTFDTSGFGTLGTGLTGESGPAGFRRHGLNEFDSTMAGTFDIFPGWTAGETVLFSDFDDGLPQHDAFGLFFGINGLGLGLDEVSTSTGDSGGPAFVNGQIAGLSTFGIRVFFADGSSADIDELTNSSFGEFNAFTRVSSYQDWIDSYVAAEVPEPATGAMLVLGGLFLAFKARRSASRFSSLNSIRRMRTMPGENILQ
jgi:secreted trypsin-like serine protease